jgi:acyl-CoA thioesterase FadM
VEELAVAGGETAAEAKAVLVACDEQHRPRPLTEVERAALAAA